MGKHRKRRVRYRDWYHPTVYMIFLLYAVAVITPLASVVFSDEWSASSSFVVTAVVVPLVALGIAFALQSYTHLRDSRRDYYLEGHQSHLMRILEEAISPQVRWSGSRPDGTIRWENAILLMYEKVVAELLLRMTQLKEHSFIEAFDDYWRFCSEFYALARSEVECTSIIALHDWTKDDMQAYLDMQRRELLAEHVTVRRTFIFPRSLTADEERTWRDVCRDQMRLGFQIYFIFLDELAVGNPQITNELNDRLYRDFALIDQAILQFGCYSSRVAQQVLYYKFFALSAPPSASNAALVDSFPKDEEARGIFCNDGEPYRLLVQKYRHRLSVYSWPQTPRDDADAFRSQFSQLEDDYVGRIVDQHEPYFT